MPVHYPQILSRLPPPESWSWSERDFIHYALCLGFGEDPRDPRALAFVYEHGLKVLPTMPTVLAWVAAPTFTDLGVDPVTALHCEQKIELHRPIRCPVKVDVQGRVLDVYDKGVGRGATVVTQHVLTDASDLAPVATLTTTCFGRAEGGCGGSAAPTPKPHEVPLRAPYRSMDFPTRPDLALWYRLTGDRNPVHADPKLAARAGFQRPILHGLCSFGITCRAVLETFAEYDPARILSHQARFSAPVYPGDTLTVDLWRDGDIISFEARVRARGVTVVKNGKSTLRSG